MIPNKILATNTPKTPEEIDILFDTKNYIFLDMDGPMITGGMYFIHPAPSGNRVFSPISVAIINKLCEKSGALIITNSAHNWQIGKTGNDLKTDLLIGGIKPEYFGTPWRTDFGNSLSSKIQAAVDTLKAIWPLDRNYNEIDGIPKWVGFDDEPMNHKNYILVDFETGLTMTHYQKALGLLAQAQIL